MTGFPQVDLGGLSAALFTHNPDPASACLSPFPDGGTDRLRAHRSERPGSMSSVPAAPLGGASTFQGRVDLG